MGKDGAHKENSKPATGAQAPTGAPHAHVPPPTNKAKGKTVAEVPAGMCTAQACKSKASRFNFCDEHYDHFKFGLIKKNGEPVSDWEKKIEHYQAYKARTKAAQKAA